MFGGAEDYGMGAADHVSDFLHLGWVAMLDYCVHVEQGETADVGCYDLQRWVVDQETGSDQA